MPTDNYYSPDTAEILRRFLRDLELGYIDAGIQKPGIDEGSEYFILGTALANMGAIIYAQNRNILKNSSELEATGKQLDDIRIALGLPEVLAAPAAGRIIPQINTSGTISFPDGLEFTVDSSGLRGKTQGMQSISAGGSLKAIMIDAGTASNADPFEAITFVSPPNNVSTQGTTDQSGMIGATDAETDEQKRERITNRRKYPPAGGNSAHAIDLAQGATASVQKAYCYPALIGPSSMRVVVTKSMQLDRSKTREFSREIPESTLEIVQNAVLGEYPEAVEISIVSALDEYFDATIELDLPNLQNGGWIDGTSFPALVEADSGKVTVTGVTSNSSITVSAQGAAPTLGQSIMWFSPVKRDFITAKITSVSGSAGAYEITLDRTLVIDETSVQVGDYISPGCKNAQAYADALLEEFNKLGPGENTDDSSRLPRAARKPSPEDSNGYSLNNQPLKNLSQKYSEILDFSWLYKSLTSPSVPDTEETPPNVLVLQNLGIYRA